MLTRRRIVATPAPIPTPSGRFDALIDMGNPMKGVILFPYLQRRVEGRALRAMAPATSLELCRTVAEAVVPRRWPREVRCQKLGLIFLIVLIVVLRCFLTGARCVGSQRGFAGRPTRPILPPILPGLDPRRCLSPRGGRKPARGGVAGHGRRLGASADGTSRYAAGTLRCGGGALDGASPRRGL
jgi:hypothetical protein